MSIAIVTDSKCDIPYNSAKKFDIHKVLVIDSRQVSLGLGFQVLELGRMSVQTVLDS